MAVNTMVIDVPMLNAAPPLRVSVIVSRPPSSRIGVWRGISATTMALEMTSAAMTNTATASSSPSRRGRAGGAETGPFSDVPGAACLSAPGRLESMVRSLSGLQLRWAGAGIPAAPRAGRPARARARDTHPLAGRRHLRAVTEADRERAGLDLLRGAAHRQRDARRASRGGAHLQRPVPQVQDHAGVPRPAQGRLGLPRAGGRGRGGEGTRLHGQAG